MCSYAGWLDRLWRLACPARGKEAHGKEEGIKAGPGCTLDLPWEGGTYIPVPSLQLRGFSSCFCPAPSCPSCFLCILPSAPLPCIHSFMCPSIHPPVHLPPQAFICSSIRRLPLLPSFPFSPSPLASLLPFIFPPPVSLSCPSISSNPSTLPSVHHHPISKHLWNTRGSGLRLSFKV